ncbi:MAG: YicC family protein [Lachnospiraceae bacterium]|nr:YicC family protein [Lachnospiraceae bacterium]
MIQSMTGFGRGEADNGCYKVVIEMKSVNHRYCDVMVRLPRKLNFFETAIRNQVKTFAARGKIDVFVSFEDLTEKNNSIKYNKEVAEAYLQGIRQLSRDFLLEDTVDSYMLSRFPEVFTTEETDMDEESITGVITEALTIAGKQFCESRKTEGEKLREDLLQKLDMVYKYVGEVEKREPEILAEYRKKLTDKVAELLGDTKIDENVLASELVVYADKICVDEELVRLKTHIVHMKETLQEEENIGRKLDFLTQEMNREANTILSKANDIEVSNLGIELKTVIEKIREQIQNIE